MNRRDRLKSVPVDRGKSASMTSAAERIGGLLERRCSKVGRAFVKQGGCKAGSLAVRFPGRAAARDAAVEVRAGAGARGTRCNSSLRQSIQRVVNLSARHGLSRPVAGLYPAHF